LVVACQAEGGDDYVRDLIGFVEDLDCGSERFEVGDWGLGQKSVPKLTIAFQKSIRADSLCFKLVGHDQICFA
jgi:hypothetical protein